MMDLSSLTNRHKQIFYRAHHRGTKEMDWLLGKYVDGMIGKMDEAALDELDQLMTEPEPKIEGWLMKKDADIPNDYKVIVSLIQKYHDL